MVRWAGAASRATLQRHSAYICALRAPTEHTDCLTEQNRHMNNPLQLPKHPRFVEFSGRSFNAAELQTLADAPSLLRLDFSNCVIGDHDIALLCDLPKLQGMWLAGTGVTDAALWHLARLPKLDWLILENTAITGTGFAAFSEHRALRHLRVAGTKVTDDVMPLLAQISPLSHVTLDNTAVTTSGLMALAAHPTLEVGAHGHFSLEMLRQFALLQRTRASRTPPGFTVIPADAEAAQAALTGFMAAITRWELEMAAGEAARLPGEAWDVTGCNAAFATFCTAKDRKYGQPGSSYGKPPEYEGVDIFATEWINPRKVFFYAMSTGSIQASQHRFLLVKKGQRWLIDHKEWLNNGWVRAYL